MAERSSLPGIVPSPPTLSARLREAAAFLGAPAAGRLTEEQRALVLGIARRLVGAVSERLDAYVDMTMLWEDWTQRGIPGADGLAIACFARAEEHRWREHSAQRASEPPILNPEDAADGDGIDAASAVVLPDIDRAYLALQIADRRRFDALGNPCLALADLDPLLFRSLLLDVAAWRLAQTNQDSALAAQLGAAVRAALEAQDPGRGIDKAAADYFRLLADDGSLADHAAAALTGHDWPTAIALAAAARQQHYADMALALVTAESATLASLLAPLGIDRSALIPLDAALAMLPGRAIGGGDTAVDDFTAILQSRAAGLAAGPGDVHP